MNGNDTYGSGEHSNNRQLKISGLHQSPSVISLHDQSNNNLSREQIQISKKRSSKDSSIRRNRAIHHSSDQDEYADEIQVVTGQYQGNSAVGL